MSSFYADPDDPAAGLRWRLVNALRNYGQHATRLAQVFSARHELHRSDLQALIAVMSAEGSGEPLTPGALRAHLGLSNAGTSYVIDRLERAGHVRRVRDHPSDSRVVHLRYTEAGQHTALAFFGPLGQRTSAVMDEFSTDELAVVTRFLERVEASTRRHLEEMEAIGDDGSATVSSPPGADPS